MRRALRPSSSARRTPAATRPSASRRGITSIKIGAIETLTGPNGAIRIRYAGTRPERQIAAWRILAGEFDPKPLDGAIVLIGATASALYDLRATPLENAVPGVDIHAEMIESVLAGAHLTRPDFMRGLETILVVIGGLFGIAAASRLPPLSGAVVTGVVVAGFIVASATAFTSLQQLFDPLWPSAASIACFGIAGVSVLRRTERERRQIRNAFAHYLSPAVVESLARDPSRLVLGGETRILTVLFSDIRGFTSRSERLSAEDVVGFLNSVHTPLTQHVLDTGGTLDKFMGDGMMAFWNAPVEVPDHVRAALRAALAMQRTVEEIDDGLRAEAAAGNQPPALARDRHRHPYRARLRRQHRLDAALRLFGDRRHREHRGPDRAVVQELQGRDPRLRGGRRGGAGFRLSLRRGRRAARPAERDGALRPARRRDRRDGGVPPLPAGSRRGGAALPCRRSERLRAPRRMRPRPDRRRLRAVLPHPRGAPGRGPERSSPCRPVRPALSACA